MRNAERSFIFFVTCIASTTATALALTPADKCEADKLKRAGLYSSCRLKSEAKAVKTGDAPDYAKCDLKFSEKWTSAESTAGGLCPTNGDEVAVHACLSGHADGVVAALMSGGTCGSGGLPQTGQDTCDPGACPGTPAGQDGEVQAGMARSYTDNGDGTITDNVTGLMWEKLADDGSLHDRDNVYTWSDTFTVKIAGLNSGVFAGYSDWRLPNVIELQSLVDFGQGVFIPIDDSLQSPCTPACVVTACSCSTIAYTWTSTTQATVAARAFAVDFFAGSGETRTQPKSTMSFVRAVRGGL